LIDDYLFPIKDNQKTLREGVETAFNAPVFPFARHDDGLEKAHGRIERSVINVLPARAVGLAEECPTAKQICRVTRQQWRKIGGDWKASPQEVVYLLTSLDACEAPPKALLQFNGEHARIENGVRWVLDVTVEGDRTRTAWIMGPKISPSFENSRSTSSNAPGRKSPPKTKAIGMVRRLRKIHPRPNAIASGGPPSALVGGRRLS
jgi:predicted transposase YbfD/YdcC